MRHELAAGRLLPSLLDRLLAIDESLTLFQVSTTRTALLDARIELDALLAALADLGLTASGPVESTEKSVKCTFTAPGRTISLTDVRATRPRRTDDSDGNPLGSYCTIDTRVAAPRDLTTVRRGHSMDQLRDAVVRDLAWLLNTTNLEDRCLLDHFPFVATSVVNFGIPPIAGTAWARIDVAALAGRIRQCIETFEPRLTAVSVTVDRRRRDSADANTPHLIEYRIEAELWGDPLPQHLLMRSTVDVATGAITLESTGTG